MVLSFADKVKALPIISGVFLPNSFQDVSNIITVTCLLFALYLKLLMPEFIFNLMTYI